jgi:hypothetical protein
MLPPQQLSAAGATLDLGRGYLNAWKVELVSAFGRKKLRM